VLIHGLGSSKEEWTTRHRRFTDFLSQHRIRYIALDLYAHGESREEGCTIDTEYIDDETWPTFVDESVARIEAAVAELGAAPRVATRIHLVSYSAGSVVAVEFLKAWLPGFLGRDGGPQPGLRSGGWVFPLPQRPAPSRYRDVHVFGDAGRLSADRGREAAVAENPWIRHREYDSGHELPAEWCDDVLRDYHK
jgi:pimeloyl-ACP methyl ester carboxylesterase